MRFIYQYPDTHAPDPDMLDIGPVADIAVALEDSGWDGLAFTEHPGPGSRSRPRGTELRYYLFMAPS